MALYSPTPVNKNILTHADVRKYDESEPRVPSGPGGGEWTSGGGGGGAAAQKPAGAPKKELPHEDIEAANAGEKRWKEGTPKDISDDKLPSTVPHDPGAVTEVPRTDLKGGALTPIYRLDPTKIKPWTGDAKDLLGIDTNAKTVHGEQMKFKTGILYLTPSTGVGGGVNMCAYATEGCSHDCLRMAGRLQQVSNLAIGVAKTKRFMADPHKFVDDLGEAVKQVQLKAKAAKMSPAVRINGTSDAIAVDMLKGSDGKTLPEKFPDVQFYDYTKVPPRMDKFLDGRMPPNYHLTFSRSEKNDPASPKFDKSGRFGNVEDVLRKGGGVAIPFSTRTKHGKEGTKQFRPADPLPTTYRGYPVIDGDKTDLRFGDRTMDAGAPPSGGYWIGLRAKGSMAKADTTSGFIVPDPLKPQKAATDDYIVPNHDPMLLTSWSRLIPDDQFA